MRAGKYSRARESLNEELTLRTQLAIEHEFDDFLRRNARPDLVDRVAAEPFALSDLVVRLRLLIDGEFTNKHMMHFCETTEVHEVRKIQADQARFLPQLPMCCL